MMNIQEKVAELWKKHHPDESYPDWLESWIKDTKIVLQCCKCGSDNIAVVYFGGGFFNKNKNTSGDVTDEKSNEHLAATCRCCGYDWREETLDNRK